MAISTRTRFVNPRLGTYFGIFASLLIGLLLLLIIFEQLGTSQLVLRWAMLLGPLVLYAIVGLCVPTREPIDFFAAGRRVPAGYTGLGIANAAMGATGLVAMTGLFFIIGFDALCLFIGGLAGFAVMAAMLAPFLRKAGSFTVPSYLGRRFESKVVRVVSAGLLSVPMLLLLAAELRMGSNVAAWLSGASQVAMTVLLVAAILISVVVGGMRSVTWSTSAQSLASILALIIPVAIVAVIVTNFPLPQLTNGPLLRSLVHTEAAQNIPIVGASGLTFALPDEGYAAVAKRFSVPFGAVGPIAFIIATLTVMAGVASSPWLLPRVTMTPGVYETRKSLGWATVFFAFVMLTAASVSVYMRDYVMDIVKDGSAGTLPEWMRQLVELGFVQIDRAADGLHFTSFKFARDKVLLSLPIAAGLPPVFVYFTATGVIAACLVAASSATVALGNIIAEDVLNGPAAQPLARSLRINVARASILAVGVVGGTIALLAPTDPLRLLLWALALTGSTLFPVIVLSIWWKRMNAFGALAGLACGFAVAVLTILAGEASILGLNGALAGILGIPAGTLGAMLASNVTPSPGRSMLEYVRQLRIPGGEVAYDREMRLLRLKNRERA